MIAVRARNVLKLIACAPLLCAIAFAAPRQGAAVFRPAGSGTLATMGSTDSVQLGGGYRVINDLGGLPAASGGFIDLQAGSYKQGADLVLGATQLRVPAGVAVDWQQGRYAIYGSGASVITIAGSMFLAGGTVANVGAGDAIIVNGASAGIALDKANLISASATGLNLITAQYAETTLSAFVSSSRGLRVGAVGYLYTNGSAFADNTTGIEFDGAAGFVTISQSTLSSSVANAKLVKVGATASLSSFEIGGGTAFTCNAGQTCIESSAVAFAVAGMRLSNNSFAGAGTYLSGVTSASQQALFTSNVGVPSTAPGGFQTVTSGVTTTTLTTAGTYYKLQTAAAVDVQSQLFTFAQGRYTNSAGRTLTCDVVIQADGTLSAANADMRMAVYKNGTTIQNPPAFGRVVSSSLSTLTARARVTLDNGEYVEPWITNVGSSGTTFTWNNGAITITYCN